MNINKQPTDKNIVEASNMMAQSIQNPITSQMQPSKLTTKRRIGEEMDKIINAAHFQKQFRKDTNDPLAKLFYYDKNKAMKMCYDTELGYANGTCVKNNKEYAAKLVFSGKHRPNHVQMIKMTLEGHDGKIIYHVAILIKTLLGIRYVSHANGKHLEISWDHKQKSQCPRTLEPLLFAVMNDKQVRWRKKDWRVMRKKWTAIKNKLY